MNRIQNKDHNTGSYRTNKIYLSFYDDKIYIFEDGYSGLSYSHKSTH